MDNSLYGTAFVFCSFGIPVGGLYLARGFRKRTLWGGRLIRRQKRSPLRANMLRQLAQSLKDRLKGITVEVLFYACMTIWIAICFVPLLKLRRLLKDGWVMGDG